MRRRASTRGSGDASDSNSTCRAVLAPSLFMWTHSSYRAIFPRTPCPVSSSSASVTREASALMSGVYLLPLTFSQVPCQIVRPRGTGSQPADRASVGGLDPRRQGRGAGVRNRPVSKNRQRFLDPTARWKHHPARWNHPAPRRTEKPAGFSIQWLAGCIQRLIGSITRPVGSIRRLAGRRNRPVSRSNGSPDGSGGSLEASPGPLEVSGASPDGETGPVSRSNGSPGSGSF